MKEISIRTGDILTIKVRRKDGTEVAFEGEVDRIVRITPSESNVEMKPSGFDECWAQTMIVKVRQHSNVPGRLSLGGN